MARIEEGASLRNLLILGATIFFVVVTGWQFSSNIFDGMVQSRAQWGVRIWERVEDDVVEGIKKGRIYAEEIKHSYDLRNAMQMKGLERAYIVDKDTLSLAVLRNNGDSVVRIPAIDVAKSAAALYPFGDITVTTFAVENAEQYFTRIPLPGLDGDSGGANFFLFASPVMRWMPLLTTAAILGIMLAGVMVSRLAFPRKGGRK